MCSTNRPGDIAFIGEVLPVPNDIDFSTNMIVIVSMGQADNLGSYTPSVSIESITVVGGVIEVRYVLRIPPEDRATLGDHVYPAHIVKTVRVDLDAKFIPRTEVISLH